MYPLLLLIAILATISNSLPQSKTNLLRTIPTTVSGTHEMIWTSIGLDKVWEAQHEFCVLRPSTIIPGFHPYSDAFVKGSDDCQTDQWGTGITDSKLVRDLGDGTVRPPTGFNVLNSLGKPPDGIVFYELIAEPGYRCLGAVAVRSSESQLLTVRHFQNYRCAREDLVALLPAPSSLTVIKDETKTPVTICYTKPRENSETSSFSISNSSNCNGILYNILNGSSINFKPETNNASLILIQTLQLDLLNSGTNSAGDRKVSFWRVKKCCAFGDFVGGSGNRFRFASGGVRVEERKLDRSQSDVLAIPLSYRILLLYNDGVVRGHFCQPVCPVGYEALGTFFVAENEGYDRLQDVARCVHGILVAAGRWNHVFTDVSTGTFIWEAVPVNSSDIGVKGNLFSQQLDEAKVLKTEAVRVANFDEGVQTLRRISFKSDECLNPSDLSNTAAMPPIVSVTPVELATSSFFNCHSICSKEIFVNMSDDFELTTHFMFPYHFKYPVLISLDDLHTEIIPPGPYQELKASGVIDRMQLTLNDTVEAFQIVDYSLVGMMVRNYSYCYVSLWREFEDSQMQKTSDGPFRKETVTYKMDYKRIVRACPKTEGLSSEGYLRHVSTKLYLMMLFVYSFFLF